MTPILVLAIAYLLGAIPFGFVVVKWVTGSDVRKGGSGNIGATNVLRTTGPWPESSPYCSISAKATSRCGWPAG